MEDHKGLCAGGFEAVDFIMSVLTKFVAIHILYQFLAKMRVMRFSFAGLAAMILLSCLSSTARAQGLPAGSYQQPYKSVAINGNVLSAWRATTAGTWQDTVLGSFSQCLHPPSNLDGTLAIGSNPPAGFLL
jgi:hypothetical protein